jgi:hypothetical protein
MIIQDPALVRSYAAELGVEDRLPEFDNQSTDIAAETLYDAAEPMTASIRKMNGEPGPFHARIPIRHQGNPELDLKTRLEIDLKKGRHVLITRDAECLEAYAFGDGYDPRIIRDMAQRATHGAVFIGDTINDAHWAWKQETYETFEGTRDSPPTVREIIKRCLPDKVNEFQFALDVRTIHPLRLDHGDSDDDKPLKYGISYHFEYSSAEPNDFLLYVGRPPKGVKPEDAHEFMEREHVGHRHFQLRELPNHTFSENT